MFDVETKQEVVHCVHKFSPTQIPFSVADYSAFKYGSLEVAYRMANELSNVIGALPSLSAEGNREIMIYSSPYDAIPTSSYYLAKFCIEMLQERLAQRVTMGKIERMNTYADNYGAMNAEQRFALISRDTYSLTAPPPNDAMLVFIDDVTITGTHQRVVSNLLNKYSISNQRIYCYYAELIDKSQPEIEDYLNTNFINDPGKLAEMILTSKVGYTTRSIKYLLCLSEQELNAFVREIHLKRPHYFERLYMLALANRYDHIDRYRQNLSLIGRLVNESNVSVCNDIIGGEYNG